MSEALKTVNTLNTLLWEQGYEDHSFWLHTNGVEETILYQNMTIWNSECDERLYIDSCDEYEPLLPHVQKLFNEMVDSLQLFKFKKKRKKK